MRPRRGLVLMLVTVLLVGCATAETERSASWLGRLRPRQVPIRSDLVQMQAALIEQPLGDPYLNGELWDLADEQVIPLERKDAMADNGFRIGVIAGLGPDRFRNLLLSDRSCINPRWIQRQAGAPTTLMLGLPLPRCRFQLRQEEQAEVVELEQVQCSLRVVPSLTADGRTRLRFTPEVLHGEAARQRRPAVDRSGTYSWMLQEHRPTEAYAGLTWEISLAPNEYVIVGGRFDRPQTLGHLCFIRGDEPNPVQRLLVIRTSRLQPSVADEGDDSQNPSPPLALQAGMTSQE